MMIGVAIIFFYFILWRPESKRRKELETKRKGLKKGDRVVVAGGILGRDLPSPKRDGDHPADGWGENGSAQSCHPRCPIRP